MADLFVPPLLDVGAGLTPSDGSQLFFSESGLSFDANPKGTFTDITADTDHANPVLSDARGVFPKIYLTGTYRAVLKDKNNVQKWVVDNINGGSIDGQAWVSFSGTPTQTSSTTFTLTGDQTATFQVGRRVLAEDSTTLYGAITASVFTSLTTVTLLMDSGSLSGSLTAVSFGLLSVTNPEVGSKAIQYIPDGAGAVATDTEDKLRAISVTPQDKGASPSASASVNTVAIQAAIDFAISEGRVLDGGNATFPVIGRITIPADCIIENLHLDFDDSDSTNFQLWFGNSTEDAPTSPNSGYTGTDIHVRNMNVKPSKTCLKPVRLRGLLGGSFTNFNVTPAEFQDAPNGAIYVHIDGMLNTKFTQCHWSPNTEGATVTTSPVTNNFQISQMFNLAFSASSGNGVTSTSSSFSTCKFRRSSRIGDVSGDDIIFNEACIFESALEGVTIIEDQSFVTFEDCYWENIDRFKIHARGVDVANPGTRVVVRGGKVQCNEDNGSAPDHAFMKVENTYSATIEKTVFQGRAQTRLIEIVVGGGTRSDCLVYQDVNVGAKTRNSSSDTIASKTLTITNSDATLSINSTAHDLIDGDIVDIIASDQSDPYLGVNQLLPSLVVTKTDDNNFTVESDLTASSSGTSVVTYRKYRDSTNCLANMDEPSQNVVERGDHQVRGQNAYNFNDTWTEFVTFSFLAASSATADTMLTNGVASYISNDTAYLKSIKYIDLSDTAPTTRFVDVFYGGNEFTKSLVKRVANSGTDRESTLQYIAPFKLHPYEPLTCVVTTAGSGNIFPRTLTCILEIAHTGLTYDNDTPK